VHKGSQRITQYHKAIPKLYPFPNHTLYSREDPRPIITTRSAIMMVVHSAVVNTLYPSVVISSLCGRLEKPLFWHSLYFLWCMAQRSLHVVTKVYYRSMSCFAMVSRTNGPACSATVSRTNVPSCTMWERWFTKYITKYDAIPHPTEQDTLPIVFLISRQAISYRTRGGTCCPRGSTSKIRFLADSGTKCHGSINHVHHSNHWSNHSIDPHTIN
jgi:hypothetical protein